MKRELPPAAIAAIVVALVLIIGFAAYKKFGGDPSRSVATAADVAGAKKMRATVMAPGVHRDANGTFLGADGKPIDLTAAPTRDGR